MQRIADLPPEIPADSFYSQMKEWNQKILDLQNAKKELVAQTTQLKSGVIDKNGLIEKLKQAIARLEEVPIENRRPLYSNIIEFAEIHPTKIRVGLNAPTLHPGQYKATGTDSSTGNSKNSKFSDCEPRKLTLASSRGSTTVTIGAPGQT